MARGWAGEALSAVLGQAGFGLRWLEQTARDARVAWREPMLPVVQARRGAARAASPSSSSSVAAAVRRCAIVALERPTADAVTLTLADDPSAPLRFEAGQFVTLTLEIEGQRLRRSYSICTDPQDADRFAITIKRVAGGIASNHLIERAAVGDVLEVAGPHGRFTLGAADRGAPLVMVAGGAGITPILSILRVLAREQRAQPLLLLYGNRGAGDIIARAALDELAARWPALTLRYVLESAAPGFAGPFGQLSGEVLTATLPPDPAARYFICGPRGMMDAVVAHLVSAGVPADHLRLERFASPGAGDAPAAPRPVIPARVTLARGGEVVLSSTGETLLAASGRTSRPIASSCQVGGCGSCRVRLLAGEVEMEAPNCLTDAESAAGWRLACVGRPVCDVVLDA